MRYEKSVYDLAITRWHWVLSPRARTDTLHWRALYNANSVCSLFAVRVIGTACISSIDPLVSRLATKLTLGRLIGGKVYFAVTSFDQIFACAEVALWWHARWLKTALLFCKIKCAISCRNIECHNNCLLQIKGLVSCPSMNSHAVS